MKKLVVALMIGAFGFANAQTDAFKGSGDLKAQVGANFQKWGTGIQASLDYGLGGKFLHRSSWWIRFRIQRIYRC